MGCRSPNFPISAYYYVTQTGEDFETIPEVEMADEYERSISSRAKTTAGL